MPNRSSHMYSRRRFLSLCGGAAAAGSVALVLPACVAKSGSSSKGSSSSKGANLSRYVSLTVWRGANKLDRGTYSGLTLDTAGHAVLDSSATLDVTTLSDDYATKPVDIDFETGTWISPELELSFGATELMASWGASVPAGCWLEVDVRGRRKDGTLTDWVHLARWSGAASGEGDALSSYSFQESSEAGSTAACVFTAAEERRLYNVQMRVTLMRPFGSDAVVSLIMASLVATQFDEDADASGASEGGIEAIDVPQYSQIAAVAGEGEPERSVPAACAMLLDWWGVGPSDDDLAALGLASGQQVAWAAAHVADSSSRSLSTAPFATAFCVSRGLVGYATRLSGLTQLEAVLELDVPVVVQMNVTSSNLPDAGYEATGHAMVVCGIDESGDVIVNDPAGQAPALSTVAAQEASSIAASSAEALVDSDAATPSDSSDSAPTVDDQGASGVADAPSASQVGDVRRTYPRADFESAWINDSAGTAWIVHSAGIAVNVG